MIFLFEPTHCGIIFKFNTQPYICKRENWGHTRMYDPKNPFVSLLTGNICNYLCNYLVPSVFRCGNNAGRDRLPHPVYHTNMVQHHDLLQIYKDARSFWEIPLFNLVRIFQVLVRFELYSYYSALNNLTHITRIVFTASGSRAQRLCCYCVSVRLQ